MHLNASEAITYAEREHIGVELDVDALARGQMNIRLQEALGVGRIHEPALIEVVDKTQLRQHAKLVIHLGGCGIGQRTARQTIESCSRPLAIEIGVGQTQRNIRSERRVRLIEAVLQQQGCRDRLGATQLAHARDGAVTHQIMLERRSQRQVQRQVVCLKRGEIN